MRLDPFDSAGQGLPNLIDVGLLVMEDCEREPDLGGGAGLGDLAEALARARRGIISISRAAPPACFAAARKLAA